MNTELLPALDVAPIPGPAWLFHVLLVLTFFLHALFMNLTLGGTILAAISALSAKGNHKDYRAVLTKRLIGINTYGISLTISTGIAPLLFVQVLYQQTFYPATILLGWIWFGFLGLLLIGYYSVYLYKFRGVPTGRSGGQFWLVLAAVAFLLIAMVHVAVNLIHSQPDKWAALVENPWAILGDPVYLPRLLHFVLAAIGFSSLVITWWAVRQSAKGIDVELNSPIARLGWRWTLWTTLLQILGGFWLLAALPREVLLGLMRGGPATLVPLALAVVLGIGMLMMLSRDSDPVKSPSLVNAVLGAMTLTIAIMSVTRHQVRVLYLEPVTSQFTLTEAPQWGNVILFAGLLAGGLLLLGWAIREVQRHPASPDNAA